MPARVGRVQKCKRETKAQIKQKQKQQLSPGGLGIGQWSVLLLFEQYISISLPTAPFPWLDFNLANVGFSFIFHQIPWLNKRVYEFNKGMVYKYVYKVSFYILSKAS